MRTSACSLTRQPHLLPCKCRLTLPLPHKSECDDNNSNSGTYHWRSLSGNAMGVNCTTTPLSPAFNASSKSARTVFLCQCDLATAACRQCCNRTHAGCRLIHLLQTGLSHFVACAGLTALNRLELLQSYVNPITWGSQIMPSGAPLGDLTQLTCLQLHVRVHQLFAPVCGACCCMHSMRYRAMASMLATAC